MPKYMMINGLKKHPFDGFRNKVLENGIKVRENISFIFEPNKVVDTGDFDLSSWVEAKYLVEVKEEKNIIDEHDEKKEDIDLEKLEDEKLDESDEEVVSKETLEVIIDNKEEYIDEDDEDEEENDDSDIEKNDIKYEMVEDGFKCTICGKVLKSEKRMSTHIRKKHSKLESN